MILVRSTTYHKVPHHTYESFFTSTPQCDHFILLLNNEQQPISNMSTSSLAAVASRINERNNALRSELTTLELLRSEEEELGKVLLAEEKSTREVRKTAPSLRRKRKQTSLSNIFFARVFTGATQIIDGRSISARIGVGMPAYEGRDVENRGGKFCVAVVH